MLYRIVVEPELASVDATKSKGGYVAFFEDDPLDQYMGSTPIHAVAQLFFARREREIDATSMVPFSKPTSERTVIEVQGAVAGYRGVRKALKRLGK